MMMRTEILVNATGKNLPLTFALSFQRTLESRLLKPWIPACAGMTSYAAIMLLLFSRTVSAEQADPTRPAWVEPIADASTPSTTTPVSSPAVAGILYSKQRQVVMLNNRFYRVGDRVGQHLITRIEPDHVQLKHAENFLTLKLPRVVSIQQHH